MNPNESNTHPELGTPPLELNVPEQCFECGGEDIVLNWAEGNVCCRGCGLVLMERILDFSSEWRDFEEDDTRHKSRVGPPNGSSITSSSATGISKRKSSKKKNDSDRSVREAMRSSVTKEERLMKKAEISIDEMTDRMQGSLSVKDSSKNIFQAFYDSTKIKIGKRQYASFTGANLKRIEASCVFIALRQAGVSRTFREMGRILGLNFRKLGETVKNIELAVPSAKTRFDQALFDKDSTMRFCRRLGFERKLGLSCANLARKLSTSILAGRFPNTIAATAIYLKAIQGGKNKEKLAENIAEVALVSPSTLLNSAREVCEAMPELVE